MKILYIHQYFNTPEGGGPLRSWHFSNALVESGMDVEVLTAGNSSDYSSKNINGITIHYLPVTYNQTYGYFNRIKSFILFVFHSIQISKKIKADLVYASSTPLTVGLIALYLKHTKNIPYIFEVRDLWPKAPIQLGYIKNFLLKKTLLYIEKHIYSKAGGLVALSNPIAEHINLIFPLTPVTTLTNISDTEYFQSKSKGENTDFITTDKLVISYIGSVGYANNLITFINLADFFQTNNDTNTLFIIAGKGSELDLLKQKANDKQLKNIKFIPYQNREGLRKLLKVTDLSYISFREEPVLKTGSPNKLFDSLAAGVPCISNIKGWWVDSLENEECVFYFPPANQLQLFQHIQQMLENPDQLEIAKIKALTIAKERFEKKKICSRFVNYIKEYTPKD